MLTITTYEHTHTQQQHKHKQMCTPEWVGVNTNGRAQAMHKWGRTGRGRRNWETNKWWCMDKWGGTACNNKSKGRYTCTPSPALVLPHQLMCAPPGVQILDHQCQCIKCYGGAEGGNPGAVDRFGNWDQAEGQGAASLILCILHVLHVNTSLLPSSRSVADYNGNVMVNQKTKKHVSVSGHSVQRLTDNDRPTQCWTDFVGYCAEL
jgi:hypothetical protein